MVQIELLPQIWALPNQSGVCGTYIALVKLYNIKVAYLASTRVFVRGKFVWIAGLNRCMNQCTLFELAIWKRLQVLFKQSNPLRHWSIQAGFPVLNLNMSHTQLFKQNEISFKHLNKLIVIISRQVLQHYNKKIISWGLILTDFLIHFILNYCDVSNVLRCSQYLIF